jgi:hypothetical protein
MCSNYRTISLISHASKVLLKIIHRRIRPKMKEEVAEEQAGLRPGRGKAPYTSADNKGSHCIRSVCIGLPLPQVISAEPDSVRAQYSDSCWNVCHIMQSGVLVEREDLTWRRSELIQQPTT